MKLKKGDKVRIKDEVSSETHRMIPPHFTEDMDELKGKVLTVSHTTLKGYLITEEAPWVLHSDWVTLVESEPEDDPKSAFKEGDKIRIKDEVSSETHRMMPPHFTEDMDRLKGKVLTVLGTTTRGNIVTEEIPWVLHPDWITLAESEPEDDFESVVAEIIKQLSEELEELSDCDRVSILEEAGKILEGDRETDYGDPVANFTRIARIASSILNEDISPEQCVVVMMAVKLSREQYKHKRDNLVDLVAYTEILNRIKELNK